MKVNKMFWVESIMEARESWEGLMKQGKVSQQYYALTLKNLPFYVSKELTTRCFMRKTKRELNTIYNDIRTLIYKYE